MTLTREFLIALVLTGLSCASAVPARANDNTQVIKITASKYHFTPDHVTLVKGQPVRLELTSMDATHGFMLRALKIDATVKRGATTSLTLTPRTAGMFKAICDHYCGLGHGEMKMTVEVREGVATVEADRVANSTSQPAR